MGRFKSPIWAGLDVYASIYSVLQAGLGEEWATPQALEDIVAKGNHGTKALVGFYDYSEDEREQLLVERDKRYAALGRPVG